MKKSFSITMNQEEYETLERLAGEYRTKSQAIGMMVKTFESLCLIADRKRRIITLHSHAYENYEMGLFQVAIVIHKIMEKRDQEAQAVKASMGEEAGKILEFGDR